MVSDQLAQQAKETALRVAQSSNKVAQLRRMNRPESEIQAEINRQAADIESRYLYKIDQGYVHPFAKSGTQLQKSQAQQQSKIAVTYERTDPYYNPSNVGVIKQDTKPVDVVANNAAKQKEADRIAERRVEISNEEIASGFARQREENIKAILARTQPGKKVEITGEGVVVRDRSNKTVYTPQGSTVIINSGTGDIPKDRSIVRGEFIKGQTVEVTDVKNAAIKPPQAYMSAGKSKFEISVENKLKADKDFFTSKSFTNVDNTGRKGGEFIASYLKGIPALDKNRKYAAFTSEVEGISSSFLSTIMKFPLQTGGMLASGAANIKLAYTGLTYSPESRKNTFEEFFRPVKSFSTNAVSYIQKDLLTNSASFAIKVGTGKNVVSSAITSFDNGFVQKTAANAPNRVNFIGSLGANVFIMAVTGSTAQAINKGATMKFARNNFGKNSLKGVVDKSKTFSAYAIKETGSIPLVSTQTGEIIAGRQTVLALKNYASKVNVSGINSSLKLAGTEGAQYDVYSGFVESKASPVSLGGGTSKVGRQSSLPNIVVRQEPLIGRVGGETVFNPKFGQTTVDVIKPFQGSQYGTALFSKPVQSKQLPLLLKTESGSAINPYVKPGKKQFTTLSFRSTNIINNKVDTGNNYSFLGIRGKRASAYGSGFKSKLSYGVESELGYEESIIKLGGQETKSGFNLEKYSLKRFTVGPRSAGKLAASSLTFSFGAANGVYSKNYLGGSTNQFNYYKSKTNSKMVQEFKPTTSTKINLDSKSSISLKQNSIADTQRISTQQTYKINPSFVGLGRSYSRSARIQPTPEDIIKPPKAPSLKFSFDDKLKYSFGSYKRKKESRGFSFVSSLEGAGTRGGIIKPRVVTGIELRRAVRV